LIGEREDWKLVIDPDEQRTILIRLKASRFRVVLLSYDDHRLRSPELLPFRFSSVALRRWIKTARGDAEGAALAKGGEVVACLEELRVIRSLKRLAIEDDSLRMEFDYGSPPYLPPEMVRRVLPIAERLCRELSREAPASGDHAP